MPDDLKVSKEEYKEFLSWKLDGLLIKKEKIENEIASIRNQLANDFSYPAKEYSDVNFGNSNMVKNTRNSIGWKYKIKDVLNGHLIDLLGGLTSGMIVEKVCEKDPSMNREIAIKSIGSALSTNSKGENPMFNKKIIQGVTYYENNENYKE